MDSAITNVVMFSFLFILFFSIALSAILLTLDVILIKELLSVYFKDILKLFSDE